MKIYHNMSVSNQSVLIIIDSFFLFYLFKDQEKKGSDFKQKKRETKLTMKNYQTNIQQTLILPSLNDTPLHPSFLYNVLMFSCLALLPSSSLWLSVVCCRMSRAVPVTAVLQRMRQLR